MKDLQWTRPAADGPGASTVPGRSGHRRSAAPKALSGLLAACLVAILVAAVSVAPAGADFRLEVGELSVDTTLVRIDFRLLDPLPAPDSTGTPVTPPAALAYSVELWRDRSSWFDALVSQRTWGYRLEYDHIRRLYRVALPDGEILETDRAGEVTERIGLQVGVPAALRSDLRPGRTYYLAVTALLTPIDLDRMDEVEAWLSGEIRPQGRSGILGVPKALIGFLADIAGLGDRAAISRSLRFRVDGLGRLVLIPEPPIPDE